MCFAVLRPVNGYKISDRIISANKELFEENLAAGSSGGSGGGEGSSDSAEGTNQRRVTFREDLEDFEPDFSTEDDYEESDIIDDDVFDEIEDSVCVEPEVPVVANGIDHPEETIIIVHQQQPPEEPPMNSFENNCKEIEEICEEIEEVIIDKNGPELGRSDTKSSIFQTDDSGDGTVIECCIVKVETKSNRLNEENQQLNHDTKRLNPSTIQSTFLKSSSPILTSSSSSSSSTSTNAHNHRSINGMKNLRKISDPKSLKMQLNFKPCCEYKLMESTRLPRYSGYYSQYGLSKEQLEKRDSRQEKLMQRRFEKHSKRHEAEVQRSQINEDAFARWLQNKMRNPRNHMKNMYDYKPERQQQNRGKHKKSS